MSGVNYHEWQSCDHDDEPGDQQRDLFGPYWAEVGPDERQQPGGWSWTVMDFDADNDSVACGFAAGEDEAKAAVQAWAEAHEHYAREIYVSAEDEAGSMGYLPEVLGGLQDARIRDVEDLWKEVTALRKAVADLQAEMQTHSHTTLQVMR